MVSSEARNLNDGRNRGGVIFWHGFELLWDPKVGSRSTLALTSQGWIPWPGLHILLNLSGAMRRRDFGLGHSCGHEFHGRESPEGWLRKPDHLKWIDEGRKAKDCCFWILVAVSGPRFRYSICEVGRLMLSAWVPVFVHHWLLDQSGQSFPFIHARVMSTFHFIDLLYLDFSLLFPFAYLNDLGICDPKSEFCLLHRAFLCCPSLWQSPLAQISLIFYIT